MDDLKTTSRKFIDVAKANTDKDYEIIVYNEIEILKPI